jgi:MFS family permease
MDQAPAPPSEADATYRVIAWRLVPFLMLCYFCAHIDRSNIGIAKLQFSKDVGITDAMFGFGAGLFYLGYLLLEVPSNLMLTRFGARVTIARIMVIWSVTSAAFALVAQPWQFYGLRFLLGAAEAGFFPGVIYYLSQWAPAERRARFTAMFMSAMAMSGVIIGPLSGLIMQNLGGVGGLGGWQWLFIIEGLPGVLLGIAAYFYLTNTPAEAKWLTPAQKAIVLDDLAREAAAKAAGARGVVHGSFLQAMKAPSFYALALMASAQMSAVAGVALWLPTILKNAGMTNVGEVGMVSAIPYVCAVVVQQLIARRSDHLGERRWHSAIPTFVAAAGWLAMPFFSDRPAVMLGLLVMATAGVFGGTGPFWTLPSAYLAKGASAVGIAIITTFGGLGAFLSPMIVGWGSSQTGNLNIGQFYYGGFLLTAATALLLLTRRAAPVDALGVPD